MTETARSRKIIYFLKNCNSAAKLEQYFSDKLNESEQDVFFDSFSARFMKASSQCKCLAQVPIQNRGKHALTLIKRMGVDEDKVQVFNIIACDDRKKLFLDFAKSIKAPENKIRLFSALEIKDRENSFIDLLELEIKNKKASSTTDRQIVRRMISLFGSRFSFINGHFEKLRSLDLAKQADSLITILGRRKRSRKIVTKKDAKKPPQNQQG